MAFPFNCIVIQSKFSTNYESGNMLKIKVAMWWEKMASKGDDSKFIAINISVSVHNIF